MKRGLPPPKANVDNVLPGLIEQARLQRERNAARGGAKAQADVEVDVDVEAGAGAEASTPPTQPLAGAPEQASVRQLRDELRGLRWLVALALVGVAALVIKVFF